MTGITRTSADLDPRRRRILFRAWHRGVREMDLVFGQFADNELADLPDSDLDELETIMAEEDTDLLKWVLGSQPVPERYRTPLFDRLVSYRPDFDVLFVDKDKSVR